MRILLATDAWEPQVNGVVRTLVTVVKELGVAGHDVEVVHPGLFRTVPCPTYPEIRLAPFPGRGLAAAWDRFQPDAVHIATEGPIGLAARRLCLRRKRPFTTAYHTRFPEYVAARTPLPTGVSYRAMRWFHGRAQRMMVATPGLRDELHGRGFPHAALWNRGVDTDLFRPGLEPALRLPGPVHVYVGRVTVEKNIEAFLELDLPGSKLVVGDGPARAGLEKRFPGVVFAGARHGEDLARHYAAGDVFVFPSKTDTFGLVMLEALACGLPVAAFPVPGPNDVIGDHPVGVLHEDLRSACLEAAKIDPALARDFAMQHTWARCAQRFFELLEPFGSSLEAAS